ncbi:sensor histidine kinase [Phascolarctobacterium faecium]|jgi:signal transduction histidine kinase|uniref:sensor histidine kinase n=2 Tax=Phascolarctobacterium faecium TaxID=33025 RepID=UPI0024303E90|nr:ATP-binding protein [Phascolarctobacterium faecium]
MFDKLRLKLTIIYTGIFSLLVVMIVTGCIILLGHSVLTHEKQEMRELIIHEGEEFVASGELPVSKHSIEVGRELAYMLQPGSDMLLHDQVNGSPVGQQLLALRSEWPQHDRKVKWVTLRDANDRLWIYLIGRDQILDGNAIVATLYMFKDLSDYYYEEKGEILWLVLMSLFFICCGAGVGYYLAGRSIKPIREMFKRQREFVADASHELRTPLTVMGIAAEGMEGDTDSNFSEFTVDTLKTMRIEIKRMNNLVAALLSLARNDAGAGDLKLEQVNFNVLFEQTLGTLSMLAEQKGLKLEQRLAQERLIIWGDRMRLEQLLTILVDNAIKYSARGTVTVSALRQNRQLVIKVEDEGIGIDTQDIERIFERFYRVDKARTRAEGGFGLGLPIAKLIVEQHQGTIEVESKKNGGSSFIVKLPLTVQY